LLASAGRNTVLSKVKTLIREVRLEQTIFGLPFVYVGALLAVGKELKVEQIFFITLAVLGARTFAMLMNRIIDREIDKRNPRTRNRAIPAGKLKTMEASLFALISLAIYLYAAFNLSPLCRILFPIPLFFFTFYPYTKRFTWLCHFFLGTTLGLAPLAGWIAVKNGVSFSPFLLFLVVFLWVSGFDIYYAIADLNFDKEEGIFSIPARFGAKNSVYLTRILHSFLLFPLSYIGLLLHLPFIYFLGVFLSFTFLLWLDFVYSPLKSVENIDLYLQRNGYFSLIYFIFILLSIWS
jgi:4-hydroxybenzoate polyprenyltransferase